MKDYFEIKWDRCGWVDILQWALTSQWTQKCEKMGATPKTPQIGCLHRHLVYHFICAICLLRKTIVEGIHKHIIDHKWTVFFQIAKKPPYLRPNRSLTSEYPHKCRFININTTARTTRMDLSKMVTFFRRTTTTTKLIISQTLTHIATSCQTISY